MKTKQIDKQRRQQQPRATDTPSPARKNTGPLTKSERREYEKLFAAWIEDGGRAAELLTDAQIARFSQLAERAANAIPRETST